MMTDMVQVSADNAWEVIYEFQMAHLHLTLSHFKGKGQGQAHFEIDYLENGDIQDKNHYSNSKPCMGSLLAYLHSTVASSKRQGQGHAHFDNKYLYILEMVTDRVEITIAIKQQVMCGH